MGFFIIISPCNSVGNYGGLKNCALATFLCLKWMVCSLKTELLIVQSLFLLSPCNLFMGIIPVSWYDHNSHVALEQKLLQHREVNEKYNEIQNGTCQNCLLPSLGDFFFLRKRILCSIRCWALSQICILMPYEWDWKEPPWSPSPRQKITYRRRSFISRLFKELLIIMRFFFLSPLLGVQ